MKGTYTHTFSKARHDVDKKINDFFEEKSMGKIEKKEKSLQLDGLGLTDEEIQKLKEYALFLKSQKQ